MRPYQSVLVINVAVLNQIKPQALLLGKVGVRFRQFSFAFILAPQTFNANSCFASMVNSAWHSLRLREAKRRKTHPSLTLDATVKLLPSEPRCSSLQSS